MSSAYKYINRFKDTIDNAWGDTNDNIWRKIIRIISYVRPRGTIKRMNLLKKKDPNADYGRKPYIYGLKRNSPKSDYNDMMREVPRRAMMDQQLAKHSEFDKPYLHDDYQEMEYLWSWPGYMHPPFYAPQFNIPQESEWGGLGCIVTTPSDPHECNDNLQCAMGVMQYKKSTSAGPITQMEDAYRQLKLKIFVNGAEYLDYTVDSGLIFPIQIHPPFVDNSLGDDYSNRWQSGDKIRIYAIDGAGNKCDTKMTIYTDPLCPEADICNCDEAAIFQLDTDNTPTTIVSGDSITVYVLGGCPPFTWSPTSGDYWFESGITWNRNNILYAGAGGCGNIASYTSLDITDNCGSTAIAGIVIKMTDGEWGSWEAVCGNAGCTAPQCCVGDIPDFEEYKYRAGNWQDGSSTAGCNLPCCGNAITLVSSATCWFNCVATTGDPSEVCRREGVGYSVTVKTMNVSRSEWICP